MGKRSDFSWGTALCGSLLIHGLGSFALLSNYAYELSHRIHQDPIDPQWAAGLKQSAYRDPAAPQTDREKDWAPEPRQPDPPADKPPEKPPEAVKEKGPIFIDWVGDPGGKGHDSKASDGDQPLAAREGDHTQAFLNRGARAEGAMHNLPAVPSEVGGDDGTGGANGAAEGGATGAKPADAKPAPTPRSPRPADAPPSAVAALLGSPAEAVVPTPVAPFGVSPPAVRLAPLPPTRAAPPLPPALAAPEPAPDVIARADADLPRSPVSPTADPRADRNAAETGAGKVLEGKTADDEKAPAGAKDATTVDGGKVTEHAPSEPRPGEKIADGQDPKGKPDEKAEDRKPDDRKTFDRAEITKGHEAKPEDRTAEKAQDGAPDADSARDAKDALVMAKSDVKPDGAGRPAAPETLPRDDRKEPKPEPPDPLKPPTTAPARPDPPEPLDPLRQPTPAPAPPEPPREVPKETKPVVVTMAQPTPSIVPAAPPTDPALPDVRNGGNGNDARSFPAPGAGRPGGAQAKQTAPPGAGVNSDSELDALSKTPSLVWHNGRVSAPDGRKVKTVNPRLTMAAYAEMTGMGRAMVVLEARIDAAGKVVDVILLRSSGSNQIDHPTILALWKWQFEPAKDKDGHPVQAVAVVPFLWQ